MFVLFNCKNEILGVYKTHKGATIAAGKLHNRIWNTFYQFNSGNSTGELVWSIKQVD